MYSITPEMLLEIVRKDTKTFLDGQIIRFLGVSLDLDKVVAIRSVEEEGRVEKGSFQVECQLMLEPVLIDTIPVFHLLEKAEPFNYEEDHDGSVFKAIHDPVMMQMRGLFEEYWLARKERCATLPTAK